MAVVGQALTSPESGWQRIDSTSSYIFKANYSTSVTGTPYGGSYIYVAGAQNTNPIRLCFVGTKIRIIAYRYAPVYYSENVQLWIDGTLRATYSLKAATSQSQTLFAEVTGLTNTSHVVEIKVPSGDTGGINLDAVDIDDTGYMVAAHGVGLVVKDSMSQLTTVGQAIRCHYLSTSGAVGVFSDFGSSTSVGIATTSSATPDGTFYWIYAGNDYRGRKILIADRNIQHTLSWNTLNQIGYTSFTGANMILDYYFNASDVTSSSYTTLSNQFLSIEHVGNGANFGGARTTKAIGSGKWYFEVLIDSFVSHTYAAYLRIGIMTKDVSISSVYTNSADVAGYTGTYVTGDIIGVSVDTIAGTVRFYRNNVLAQTLTGYNFSTKTFYPVGSTYLGSPNTLHDKITFNFGNKNFVYTPPSGHQALSSSIDNSLYRVSVRTLTGGVSSSDLANEWDQYVRFSTLGGSIAAGDTAVWNFSVPSWTSTTNATNTSRVIRGGASVDTYTESPSSTSTSSVGFRPVLIIESLEVTATTNQYLIVDGSDVKYYNGSTWQIVGAAPVTQSMINSYGMDDLTALTAAVMAQLGANVQLVSFVPDANTANRNVSILALPASTAKVITQNQDISIQGDLQSFALSATSVGAGILRIIASADSGATWKAWDAGTSSWVSVTKSNLSDVKNKGMTSTVFNAITNSQWLGLITNQIVRFAYYLELTAVTDVASVEALTLTDRVYPDTPSVTGVTVSYAGIDPAYYGLLFLNSADNVIQKVDGTILTTPSFGSIIAGESSSITTFKVQNAYNFSVQNLVIEPYNVPTGVTVKMSKTSSPFTDDATLTFNSTYAPDATLTFYVKIDVAENAGPLANGTINWKVRGERV